MKSVLVALLAAAVPALAQWSGLATTTRYSDGYMGACGCGPSGTNVAFGWQYGLASGVYTAAGSQNVYDNGGETWCGHGCGTCYRLTSQGYSACPTCGTGGVAGQSIIVMITNLCPHSGNEVWCPVVNGVNQYGYEAHFDIMATSEVFGDNPVVEFTQIACPNVALGDYNQCECYPIVP